MGDGVAEAAGQCAISQRLCKCVTHLHSNFPQEFVRKQVVEEPVEEQFSRDCDETMSAYEPLRESIYLHRSRFIVCGASNGKHIQKGVGCQEYFQSTRTILQFPSASVGISREIERAYRSGRHLRMAYRRVGGRRLRLRGGWNCAREQRGVALRTGVGGARHPGRLDCAASIPAE